MKNKWKIITIVILFLLLPISYLGFKSDIKDVSNQKAKELISKKNNLIILDVREEEAYNISHIPNAISIPLSSLVENSSIVNQYENNSILVYCKSGISSKSAIEILQKYNFKSIYNLKDGISNWTGALET